MNEVNSVKELVNKPNKKVILWVVSIALTVAIFIGDMVWKNTEKKGVEQGVMEVPDFSEVINIGDLMTIECYYHNVAEYEKQPDGLFQYGWGQVGYKKFWIEYTGTVKIGIDINKVKIGEPDENGIVRVYVPEVEKFEANQDTDSIQEPIYEKGVFTSITTEEKTAALAKAQEDMVNTAKADQEMIGRARENAKTIIKQYIVNAGTALGKEYRVHWVDNINEVNVGEERGTEDGEKE